jgi:hypothetical protein
MKRRSKKVEEKKKNEGNAEFTFTSTEVVKLSEENREIFISFHTGLYTEVKNFCSCLNKKDLWLVTEDEVFHNAFHRFNICFLARVLRKLVHHFEDRLIFAFCSDMFTTD